MSHTQRYQAASGGLILLVCLVFWRVVLADFVCFDDMTYVVDNAVVRGGLTLAGLRWAFSSFHASNWHPLTWVSHMCDVSLFGVSPAGHHFVNLLLHAVNTLLLFGVLDRMTGRTLRCVFVAALFAIHPLHVESVAWIAERKDVLSTVFWLATMWAYVSYVEQAVLWRYALVLILFTLGLLAKPMLVTLPCVLLLLDYWPLQRLTKHGATTGSATSLASLVYEKLPLLTLALGSCVVTFIAQHQGQAVVAIDTLPIGDRLANASVSYAFYLAKTLWPSRLAVFYPHPGQWSTLIVAATATLLTALSVLAVCLRRRAPYALVGWFWYLGTLVPVIGVVQVGAQAAADRYTYVPLIGIFILATWGACDFAEKRLWSRVSLPAASLLVLFVLGWIANHQTAYWQNSIALFDHALAVTPDNSKARYCRGIAYEQRGEPLRAIDDYTAALSLLPNYVPALNNRGVVYYRLGRFSEARSDFDAAIQIDPLDYDAFTNRGNVLDHLGQTDLAEADLKRAIQLRPSDPKAINNLAGIYAGRGLISEAIDQYSRAVLADPLCVEAMLNRGAMRCAAGDYAAAVDDFTRAIEVAPQAAESYYRRAGAYAALGDRKRAGVDVIEAAKRGHAEAKALLAR